MHKLTWMHTPPDPDGRLKNERRKVMNIVIYLDTIQNLNDELYTKIEEIRGKFKYPVEIQVVVNGKGIAPTMPHVD